MLLLGDVGGFVFRSRRTTVLLYLAGLLLAGAMGIMASVAGEMQALLALLFILCMIATLSNYQVGVLLLIFLLPLSATRLIPREMMGVTGLNPFNVTILVTLFSLLLTAIVRPQAVRLPKPPSWLLLYLAVFTLAMLQGLPKLAAIPAYYRALDIVSFDSASGYIAELYLKPLIVVVTSLLLAVAVARARKPEWYIAAFLSGTIVLALNLLTELVLRGASLSSMIRGGESFAGMHSNEMGIVFNMAAALCLFCFRHCSTMAKKCLLAAAFMILVLAIVLSFSRGAYLGFLAVMLYFLLQQKNAAVLLAGAILIPVLLLCLPDAVLQRAMTGFSDRDVDAISAGRINEIWMPLLPGLAEHPLLGQGLGSILWSEPARTHDFFMTGRIGHPHSAYLGALLDFGVLGLLAILFFYWHAWQLFRCLARMHPEPIWRAYFHGAMAGVLVMLIQGLTDDRFTPTVSQSIFWLSYGMALGYSARLVVLTRPSPASYP